MKDTIRYYTSLAFWILVLYLIVVGINYDVNYWEWKCHDSATVVEITEVSHRTAWATLSNGESREFNQPQELVPGKDVCLSGERVRVNQLPWWMLPAKIFE